AALQLARPADEGQRHVVADAKRRAFDARNADHGSWGHGGPLAFHIGSSALHLNRRGARELTPLQLAAGASGQGGSSAAARAASQSRKRAASGLSARPAGQTSQ